MTLFPFPGPIIKRFKELYNLDVSNEFLSCADKQLTPLFVATTSLKFGNNLCLSYASESLFFYTKEKVSKLLLNLYVNHHWNNLIIVWKSKSGKIYEPSDTQIDGDDIEFDFENLETDLYKNQLFPKIELPFELPNLNYQLIVRRLNKDAQFAITLNNSNEGVKEEVVNEVNHFINAFNERAEKNESNEGIVHSSKMTVKSANEIIFNINLGTTGVSFLRSFLLFLSDLNQFSVIEIL